MNVKPRASSPWLKAHCPQTSARASSHNTSALGVVDRDCRNRATHPNSLATPPAKHTFFPERHPIEFIEEGLVKPLTDPIGPGTLGFRARVIDSLHYQKEFILMALWASPVLRAPIG